MSDAPTAQPSKAPSKAAIINRLLSRPRGASLADIIAATGWQAHSVRAFLSGLRKAGKTRAREQRRDGASAYRIVASSAAAPVEEATSDA